MRTRLLCVPSTRHTLQTKLRNSNASAQHAAMLAVHAFVRSARTIRAPTSIHQRSSDEMTNSIGPMKIAKNSARLGGIERCSQLVERTVLLTPASEQLPVQLSTLSLTSGDTS